jgi:uncharacterized membrane protein YgaE (UPF0421/DUF939 family)
MTQSMRIGRKIGAVIGAIVFLIFGVVPGFYFGSYGTVVVLSHLMGGPVEPNILVRMLVVVGILLGLFCIGSVSIVLGALFGTVVGYLTEAVSAPSKAKELAAAKAENK